jgi:putative endonuclease
VPQLSSSASAIIGVDGGFECLSHHWVLLPEVLEGNNTRRQQYIKATNKSMKGYMYILLCANGSYYTGSTIDLERRLAEHQNGEGANHTKKHLPVTLVYYEEYTRIDTAFYREKQVQGWSRKKKEALIEGNSNLLPELAKAYRDLGK